MADKISNSTSVIKIGSSNGHTIINKNSPLQRLHFFDGKFLRAPDLILEQQAILNQVRISNQAGGAGVVHGFDCTEGNNDDLQISSGFAIDFAGKVLLLNNGIEVDIAELIEKSRNLAAITLRPAPAFSSQATGFEDCQIKNKDSEVSSSENDKFYLISIHHSEAYCGEEDVYGKLCSEACSTSTDRSYIIEGIEVRAIPIHISGLKNSSAVTLTQEHLRSRVAAAYFAQEQARISSHISAPGLASSMWCQGTEALEGIGVPIAVLGRNANMNLFLDAWTVRRERMEAPPRHYWAGRMAMRSWPIYLAQILQFQCHLRKCLGAIDLDTPGDVGPCADAHKAAKDAAEGMRYLIDSLSKSAEKIAAFTGADNGFQPLTDYDGGFTRLEAQYQQLIDVSRVTVPNRLMINCGIVDVPSAGYLPVSVSSTISVNEQVQRLFGEGVDLRFCVVRPDFVAHALEEAQHMQRICLLSGLDDPAKKPQLDVLVPDGRIEAYESEVEGTGYEMDVHAGGDDLLGDITKNVNADKAVVDMQKIKGSDAAFSQSSRLFNGVQFNPKKIIDARSNPQAGTITDAPAVDQEEKVLGGAARGETLESGGVAFYFAGRMPQLMRQVIATMARDQILQQAGETVLSQAKSSSDTLSQRATNDNAAASSAAAVKAKEESSRAAAIEMNATRLGSSLKVSKNTTKPIYDTWLSMRTEQDPFKMERGGFTNVSGELVIMISLVANNVTVNAILEVTQNGSLTVEEILSSGTELRRRCAISSNGMINIRTIIGENSETVTIPFKLAETLYISRENTGRARPTFKLDLPELSAFDVWDTDNLDIDVGFQFIRDWTNAEEAVLQGFVTYLQRYTADNESYNTAGSLPLFSGAQRINPDVLKPDNLRHDTALTALREIGNGLKDNQFSDIRARQLFPPPKPIPEELLVYGTWDWVLFHRRRDIACGYDEAPQAVIKPLRYRLYYINSLSSKEEFELLRNGLLDNKGAVISRFGPIASSIAEYDAGLPSVRTSHINLRNDWQALVNDPTARIILGAIGSWGAAFDEGVAMAQMRLESISEVLSPVTPLDEDAEQFTLRNVPDVLSEGSVDGVIVLASVNIPSNTICHQVYRVEMQLAEIDNFSKSLQVNYNGTLLEYQAELLEYKPRFIDKTADLANAGQEASIQTAWQAVGNSQPQYLFAVTQGDAAGNVINDQPYLEQGRRIVSAVQGSADIGNKFVTINGDIGACPGVSILVTTPQVQLGLINVYAFKTESVSPIELNAEIKAVIQEMGYWEWMTSADVTEISMGIVGYDANDVANDTNLRNIKNKAIADGFFGSNSNHELFITSISKKGATTVDKERNKKHAEQIWQTLTTKHPQSELENSSTTWTDEGTSSVLLVAINQLDIEFFGSVMIISNATGWSSAIPEALVTDFKEEITVDESGKVSKDVAFETAVKAMVEKGEMVKNIEIVGLTAAEAEAGRQKTEAILAEMRAAGVANADTKIVTRVAKGAERTKLKKMATAGNTGVIMTR